ncbi:hypothetical protein Hypma_014296 [Hypsizygus marmoreus]|uniref:Mitochondrial K+-H+ exchange-related-domain-containing protein n=1 Tax=Hypsizygus marmoreus TaxID=39966 RepID=A0A369JEL5_HYPMA|nr:hypothetical protein Hypma_014296 [Hypsizygus marmoreus]
MSITPKALRKMRIIAIPLTRPILAQPHVQKNAHPRILTYYQFQISSPLTPSPSSAGEEKTPKSRWIPEGGVMKWMSTKAADTWAGFGKAEGGWKLKVYQAGERFVDRMEFEELALKGINPSLGPKIPNPDAPGDKAEEATMQAQTSIPLIYPPSINTATTTLDELRTLVAARIPRHRRGFYIWMFVTPFTAPLKIIPIIPNIPFFFCVWRSWSHYKAYRASQYLQSLLDAGIIILEPSPLLDVVYKDYSPAEKPPSSPSSSAESQSTPPRRHELLLTRDAVPAILNVFGLKPSAGADLLRAVEQARVRVRSGRDAL